MTAKSQWEMSGGVRLLIVRVAWVIAMVAAGALLLGAMNLEGPSASGGAVTTAAAMTTYQYDRGQEFSHQQGAVSILMAALTGTQTSRTAGLRSNMSRNARTVAADATAGASSSYLDITSGSSIRNIGTDVTPDSFADTLTSNGWTSSTSSDGVVQIFENGGAKYVLRGNAGSYSGWTADYYAPGSSSITTKLRLGYNP